MEELKPCLLHSFNEQAQRERESKRKRLPCHLVTRAYPISPPFFVFSLLLHRFGVELGDPEAYPSDPFTAHMAKRLSPRPSKPRKEDDALTLFLENDRKVLRFFCQWDDSANLFGEKRNFCIHYFLADNSLEVRESHVANSGRDAFPLLLARKKDVRNANGSPLRPIDFKVGSDVSFYGRKMFIYNCDDFTRNYYKVRIKKG